jgi:D-amino-acid dehydrogenase
MKIAVVGAGIIGITTAWELAADGHDVTVFERRSAAAEESSFANAGVVAPGYVTPWAAPGMPWKVLSHLASRHAPVKIGSRLGAQDLAWIARWWRACSPSRYQVARANLQKLAFYSRQRLHAITADLQLAYDRSDGYMVLLRSESDRKMIAASLQVLKDAGVPFHDLDEKAARRVEPALNPDTPFFGGIHLPADEVGNCRQFALLLKNECQRVGVTFEFNKTVTHLRPLANPGGVGVKVADETTARAFHAVVVCAGLAAMDLLQPLRVKVPMTAVYGYSVSAPIREPIDAPLSAVMDERFKVAISRLGQRVRVAGSAELGGRADQHRKSSIQTLYKVLQDWFPGAAIQSQGVQVWKGARPMLPDGPPVIGPCAVPGIWLNLGHGSSGWALSCGSARALADLIGGKPAALDLAGFAQSRFA